MVSLSIGKLISSSFPFRIPGIKDGTNEKDFITSDIKSNKFHPSCNLISKPDYSGWGTFYSSPDMYGLFYSFTLMYIISSMIKNYNVNIFILAILLFFFLVSSYFRTQVFYCVEFRDILIGLIVGGLLGLLWFIFVSIIEKTLKANNLTYFNSNKKGAEKCSMKNKQFRCKKIKVDNKKDNNLNDIKAMASQEAINAIEAANKLDKVDNFQLVFKLYKSILNSSKNDFESTNTNTTNDNNFFEYLKDNSNNNFSSLLNEYVITQSSNKNSEVIQQIYGVESLNKPLNQNVNISENNSEDGLVFLNTYYTINENNKIQKINSDETELYNIIFTNYLLFNNWFKKQTETNEQPQIINKIYETIRTNSEGSSSSLPIKILYNNLKNPNDLTKIQQILLETS